jgi:hypothetical protein
VRGERNLPWELPLLFGHNRSGTYFTEPYRLIQHWSWLARPIIRQSAVTIHNSRNGLAQLYVVLHYTIFCATSIIYRSAIARPITPANLLALSESC